MLFAIASLTHSQVPVGNDEAAHAIAFGTLQHLSSDDSAAQIVEKAAKVLPCSNQTAWMRLEQTSFIHFGPDTFRGVEWGTGLEDPSVLNPTELDADQWIRAIKNAGGKELILVCKHQDGLRARVLSRRWPKWDFSNRPSSFNPP
jgi:alpha-L-fucosidase